MPVDSRPPCSAAAPSGPAVRPARPPSRRAPVANTRGRPPRSRGTRIDRPGTRAGWPTPPGRRRRRARRDIRRPAIGGRDRPHQTPTDGLRRDPEPHLAAVGVELGPVPEGSPVGFPAGGARRQSPGAARPVLALPFDNDRQPVVGPQSRHHHVPFVGSKEPVLSSIISAPTTLSVRPRGGRPRPEKTGPGAPQPGRGGSPLGTAVTDTGLSGAGRPVALLLAGAASPSSWDASPFPPPLIRVRHLPARPGARPSAPWRLVELRDIAVASWGLPLRFCGESGTTRSGVSPSWFALLRRTVSEPAPGRRRLRRRHRTHRRSRGRAVRPRGAPWETRRSSSML